MPQRVCPKCGFAQDESREDCAQCGIVFAKYHSARDAILGKTSARIGEPPPDDERRVRPMTLVLALLCLVLGFYAIRTSDLFDDPTVYIGVEEGISRGGNLFTPQRERVQVAVVDTAAEEWTGPTCYGIRVFADAERIAGEAADGAGVAATEAASKFYTYATYDSVLEFYRGMFGPARVYMEPVKAPEDHPDPDSVAGLTGRRSRWYATAATADGQPLHVDIQVQTPFFGDDGSFHPDGTLISCALTR